MHTPRRPVAFASFVALVGALASCSANGGGSSAGGAGAGGSGGGSGGSGGLGGGFVDAAAGDGAFDPDAACGYAKIQTEREPGSILVVLDRSKSMSDAPDGNAPTGATPAKWESAKAALATVLAGLAPDVGVGLYAYPTELDACGVDPAPQVGVGPVGSWARAILAALATPPAGSTPTAAALDVAYGYLDGLSTKGAKAVLLITDGAWNCGSGTPAAVTQGILSQAATVRAAAGILTFAIAVPGASDDDLSQLAHAGGTDKTPSCVPICRADPFNPQECCHYSTDAASFDADLTRAIDDVASRFLTSCVFAVPKGQDPSQFDPAKVNVVVTQNGVENLVAKAAANGWSYVGGGTDEIVIDGPFCDAILHSDTTVEIVLGCPTGELR